MTKDSRTEQTGRDGTIRGRSALLYSDERLKQAVAQVESALAGLRQLSTPPTDDDEVQAPHFFSDERLKQAVAPATGLLAAPASVGPMCG